MEYIKCPECGTIVEKVKGVCSKCGYPFDGNENVIDTILCPECNAVVEKKSSSCSNCGYPFEKKDDFEKKIQEMEQKAREQELRALEAEKRLKELQEEQEQKRIAEQKKREQEERERKLKESQKKIEENERRALEAEKKLKELQEQEEREQKLKEAQNELEKKAYEAEKGLADFYTEECGSNKCFSVKENSELREEEIITEEANDSENLICDTEENKAKEAQNNLYTTNNNSDEFGGLPVITNNLEESKNSSVKEEIHKKILKNNKTVLVLGIALIAVVVGIVVVVLRGTPVESIELEYENASLEMGNFGKLDYTIMPSDATNKDVEWESSDESIVQVDEEGLLIGVKEGTCEITVKASNGKSDVCKITVEPAGPNLQAIYNQYCDQAYASIAADGSYLSIDTNPDSSYVNYEDEAIAAIFLVNDALGIPDSVVEKMGSTRAIDGVQSQICGEIEVRWSYHPDNGLEVIYSLIE